MNAKDLLNNSTVVALLASASITTGADTKGAITDLLGIGRKIHVIINAGTPVGAGDITVAIEESNIASMLVGTPGTLSGDIDATQKYIDINAAGGLQWPSIGEFSFKIDDEIFICTKRVVDRLYVKRAQYSSTAASHTDTTALALYIATLATLDTVDAAGIAEADLAPTKRYIRLSYTVTGTSIPVGIEGVIYLEREIPSGI